MGLQRIRACNCVSLKIDWGGFKRYRCGPIHFQRQMKNLTVASVSNTRAGRRKMDYKSPVNVLFRYNVFLELSTSNQKKTVLQKMTNTVYPCSPICAIIWQRAICFRYVDFPLIFGPVIMTKLLPSVRYVLLDTGFSTAIFSRMGCHPCLIAKVSVNSGRTK